MGHIEPSRNITEVPKMMVVHSRFIPLVGSMEGRCQRMRSENGCMSRVAGILRSQIPEQVAIALDINDRGATVGRLLMF